MREMTDKKPLIEISRLAKKKWDEITARDVASLAKAKRPMVIEGKVEEAMRLIAIAAMSGQYHANCRVSSYADKVGTALQDKGFQVELSSNNHDLHITWG